MSTRLLYREDPYLRSFSARVLACEPGPNDTFRLLLDSYDISRFDETRDSEVPEDTGLVILSKYRILRSATVLTPHSSSWADLLVDEDTLRVFNNHLHSTAINADDNEYITTRRFLSDTAREVKFRSIVSRLRANSELRAAQVDSISTEIRATRWGRLVCGDFNDTPMSYTYSRMRGDMKDAFQQKGRGAIYTYRGLMGLFRIDYLFHTKEFETVDYQTEQPEWSDHNPVVVDLKLKH